MYVDRVDRLYVDRLYVDRVVSCDLYAATQLHSKQWHVRLHRHR